MNLLSVIEFLTFNCFICLLESFIICLRSSIILCNMRLNILVNNTLRWLNTVSLGWCCLSGHWLLFLLGYLWKLRFIFLHRQHGMTLYTLKLLLNYLIFWYTGFERGLSTLVMRVDSWTTSTSFMSLNNCIVGMLLVIPCSLFFWVASDIGKSVIIWIGIFPVLFLAWCYSSIFNRR